MKIILTKILNFVFLLLDDPEPLEYTNEWKGWYFIPILAMFLLIGYWVRKRKKK